jgi:hypothetical protein
MHIQVMLTLIAKQYIETDDLSEEILVLSIKTI